MTTVINILIVMSFTSVQKVFSKYFRTPATLLKISRVDSTLAERVGKLLNTKQPLLIVYHLFLLNFWRALIIQNVGGTFLKSLGSALLTEE